MVYTEYFVRGTEPADHCPYHTLLFPGMLATSGSLPEPTAPPSPAAAASIVTGGTAAATGTIAANPAEPTLTLEDPAPPRRGFWSRIFGRGPDNEERKREEERRKQEEAQRQKR